MYFANELQNIGNRHQPRTSFRSQERFHKRNSKSTPVESTDEDFNRFRGAMGRSPYGDSVDEPFRARPRYVPPSPEKWGLVILGLDIREQQISRKEQGYGRRLLRCMKYGTPYHYRDHARSAHIFDLNRQKSPSVGNRHPLQYRAKGNCLLRLVAR